MIPKDAKHMSRSSTSYGSKEDQMIRSLKLWRNERLCPTLNPTISQRMRLEVVLPRAKKDQAFTSILASRYRPEQAFLRRLGDSEIGVCISRSCLPREEGGFKAAMPHLYRHGW